MLLHDVNNSTKNVTININGVNEGRAIVLSILSTLLILVTIIGNALVVLSIIIFRSLRTVSNIFITSLAAADFIMGCFVLPLGAHYVIADKWLLGHTTCHIWISVDVLSVTASIGTLSAIAMDRFIATVFPFHYRRKVTRPRTRLAILAIWSVSFLIAFVPIHAGWWKSTNPIDLACYNDPHCCEFFTNKVYAVLSSLVSFYIPLIILVTAYSIVFAIAHKLQSTHPHGQERRTEVVRRASVAEAIHVFWEKRQHRAVLMARIIVGTFVICWLPFFVLNVTQVFCNRCIDKPVYTAANWLGYANSFFNPFIYCHSKEFRRAFKKLLRGDLCTQGYRITSRGALSDANIFNCSPLTTNSRRNSRWRTSTVI
ncbi:unnamed protein product [Clavelina lepadiformis]|uniref:G-protein coupled receptors family 1 profile domain-containing protein n=1 Tax=Clavelina lepadiformis TaxID=159417 RepID=A0ABP0F1X1_CLALP